MAVLRLQLSDSLHAAARALAGREGVTLNQLITLALAEKVSALMTEECLEQRAARASRKRFRAALRKVPAVQPQKEDRL